MVLVLDNYDSFTWNLVQSLGELGARVVVRRNDHATVDDLLALGPDRIVISPGPGRPEDAGVTLDLVRRAGDSIPVLGVCLGHQAVAVAYGGTVVRAPRPVHGKSSRIEHDGRGLFAGLHGPFAAGRYHSLIVREEGLPPQLEVAARSQESGLIMALRHRVHRVHGVQFHPESVLTDTGRQILHNFLTM